MLRSLDALSAVLVALVAVAPAGAAAQDAALGQPTILVIEDGRGGSTALSRADLEGFEQHEIRTSTEWTDGVSVFRGPLARDVLAAAGALSTAPEGRVAAVALNDYSVEIPTQDFLQYRVLLALSLDGQPLTRRDKGPIWIAYPRDDHPELHDASMNSRWIWQLSRLQAR